MGVTDKERDENSLSTVGKHSDGTISWDSTGSKSLGDSDFNKCESGEEGSEE